jgi:hypothetical protein
VLADHDEAVGVVCLVPARISTSSSARCSRASWRPSSQDKSPTPE